MLNVNTSQYFKILNLWLGFVLFLSLISQVPNYITHFMTWVNYSLFFFIFLQCVIIVRKEVNNKAIFINLAAYSLIYSLSFLNSFIGKGAWIENDQLANYIFQYRSILLGFLLSISIIYICVRFVFRGISTIQNYLIALLILMPVFIWHFGPYFLDKNYLFDITTKRFDYTIFDQSQLQFTFFSFSLICAYAILLYKEENSLGEYVNALMVCFFILCLLDIVDIFSVLYHIKLFYLSQYVLFTILIMFIVILFRKVNFVYSDFGQFYDCIVVDGNKWGIPIKRKRNSLAQSFLTTIRQYLVLRKNTFGFVILSFVFSLNYLEISLFLKLNIAAVTFAIIVLFFYISALYQKRLSSGNLLSSKNRSKLREVK